MMMPTTAGTRSGIVIGTVTLLLVAAVLFVREMPGASHGIPKDFAQYLTAGQIIRNGEPEALYTFDALTGITTEHLPPNRYTETATEMGLASTSYFVYPPWVGALYLPLTFVSPYQALVLAYMGGWLACLAAVVLVARSLPRWGWVAAGATFLLLIHTFSFHHGVVSGQASLPLLLLVALMGHAHWRGRDAEAGIWWALAAGLKLFPLLFIFYFALLRRWRTLIAFFGAGALLVLFSVLVTDVDTHLRFWNTVRDYLGYTTARSTNFSLVGFLLRLRGDSGPDTWNVITIPAAIAWSQRVVFLGLLVAVLALVRRAAAADRRWGLPLAFGMMTTWVFLASANVWSHQLVALAVPFVVVTAYILEEGGGRGWYRYLLWAGSWGGLFAYDAYERLGTVHWPAGIGALAASTSFLGLVLFIALQLSLLGAVADRSR